MAARVPIAILILGAAALAGEKFKQHVGQLQEFPREIRRGKELVLKGNTRGAFRNPELIVIAPDGRTFKNKDNEIVESDFTFTVRFEHGVGAYRMEVIAHRPNSTQSMARFTVWYGQRRPPVVEELPPPEGAPTPIDIHPRLVEKRLLRTLNAFRASIKAPPVRWDEAVSARCREHAERMARARRRIHKFPPYGGVLDMLRRDGAGSGDSGPDGGWRQVTSRRPFDRPAPQPPGPRVYNHVVPFVLADIPQDRRVPVSMEKLFETFFVREAAFRICAADPYCVSVGIGAARPRAERDGKGRKKANDLFLRADALYWSVCFVQVNDKSILDEQSAYYDRVLARTTKEPTPESLRRLGVWGRGGRAQRLLVRLLGNRAPETASAAFDGLLLLGEKAARSHFAKAAGRANAALQRGEYARALAFWRPFLHVIHDGRVGRAATEATGVVEAAARDELAAALKSAEPERGRRLKELLRRAKGMKVEAEARAALGG